MIDKVALLCSIIPIFNAHSDLLTDRQLSFYSSCIYPAAIDLFWGYLSAGTGNLAC